MICPRARFCETQCRDIVSHLLYGTGWSGVTSGHAAIAEKRGFRLILVAARPESAPCRMSHLNFGTDFAYNFMSPVVGGGKLRRRYGKSSGN